MTGSEAGQVFVEALYQGFPAGKEPDDAGIAKVIAQSVPLAVTMAEKIEGLRKWAQSRAQFATSQEGDSRGRAGKRKIVSEPGTN